LESLDDILEEIGSTDGPVRGASPIAEAIPKETMASSDAGAVPGTEGASNHWVEAADALWDESSMPSEEVPGKRQAGGGVHPDSDAAGEPEARSPRTTDLDLAQHVPEMDAWVAGEQEGVGALVDEEGADVMGGEAEFSQSQGTGGEDGELPPESDEMFGAAGEEPRDAVPPRDLAAEWDAGQGGDDLLFPDVTEQVTERDRLERDEAHQQSPPVVAHVGEVPERAVGAGGLPEAGPSEAEHGVESSAEESPLDVVGAQEIRVETTIPERLPSALEAAESAFAVEGDGRRVDDEPAPVVEAAGHGTVDEDVVLREGERELVEDWDSMSDNEVGMIASDEIELVQDADELVVEEEPREGDYRGEPFVPVPPPVPGAKKAPRAPVGGFDDISREHAGRILEPPAVVESGGVTGKLGAKSGFASDSLGVELDLSAAFENIRTDVKDEFGRSQIDAEHKDASGRDVAAAGVEAQEQSEPRAGLDVGAGNVGPSPSSELDLDDETEIDTAEQRKERAKARKPVGSASNSVLEKGLGFLWEGMSDSQPPERKVDVPAFDFDWNEKTLDREPGHQAESSTEAEESSSAGSVEPQERGAGDLGEPGKGSSPAREDGQPREGEASVEESTEDRDDELDTEDGGKKKGIFRRLFRR